MMTISDFVNCPQCGTTYDPHLMKRCPKCPEPKRVDYAGLKRCPNPFCGERGELTKREWQQNPGDGLCHRYRIKCTVCGLKTPERLEPEEARVLWNEGRPGARPQMLGDHSDLKEASENLLKALNPTTGAELIAEERKRQIDKKGWTAEHDDTHTNGALVTAALWYLSGVQPLQDLGWVPWPFEGDAPHSQDRSDLRELVIAGALIAAEIDRRLRKGEKP